jgi:aromatic ring-cleaving dioxygenase
LTAFSASIVFDPTHKSVPKDVLDEVWNIWDAQELGNDTAYYSIHLKDEYISEFAQEHPKLYEYLKNNTPNENLVILIHLCW